MKLYRPVGVRELELVAASGFREFPPRLAWQPIFYPVLNRDYAVSIARDWNTKDAASGFAGFVTGFEVTDDYVSRFQVQQVGAAMHRELWVPAAELAEFNQHIIGEIRVVVSHYGESFAGKVEPSSGLPFSVVFADTGKRIMAFAALKKDILRAVAGHEGEWYWYQLDRWLSNRCPEPPNGLMEALEALAALVLIEIRSDPDFAAQPRYWLTDAGRLYLAKKMDTEPHDPVVWPGD